MYKVVLHYVLPDVEDGKLEYHYKDLCVTDTFESAKKEIDYWTSTYPEQNWFFKISKVE